MMLANRKTLPKAKIERMEGAKSASSTLPPLKDQKSLLYKQDSLGARILP